MCLSHEKTHSQRTNSGRNPADEPVEEPDQKWASLHIKFHQSTICGLSAWNPAPGRALLTDLTRRRSMGWQAADHAQGNAQGVREGAKCAAKAAARFFRIIEVTLRPAGTAGYLIAVPKLLRYSRQTAAPATVLASL
jgi:hypothetical protein